MHMSQSIICDMHGIGCCFDCIFAPQSELIDNSINSRAFAAILLRRLLTNSWEVFAVSPVETQNMFKLKLLDVSYS